MCVPMQYLDHWSAITILLTLIVTDWRLVTIAVYLLLSGTVDAELPGKSAGEKRMLDSDTIGNLEGIH